MSAYPWMDRVMIGTLVLGVAVACWMSGILPWRQPPSSLCGAVSAGKIIVMDHGELLYCDGAGNVVSPTQPDIRLYPGTWISL